MMPDAINTIESSNDLIRAGIGFGTFAPYKAGISRIMIEKQRQLDLWLSEQ